MSETSTQATPGKRKVGIMLGIGIFFLPIVFAWFLLRKGHSTLSRVLGFGWLGLVCLVALFGGEPTSTGSTTGPAASNAAPAAATIGIGDTVQTSGVAVQIKSVDTRQSVGGEYTRETASEGGVLVIVRYSLKNTGEKPLASYDRPQIKLIDGGGVVYDADLGKSSAYATEDRGDTKIWSDLNPGITTYGAEVFEVGQDRYDPKTWRVMIGDKSRLVAIE